MAEYRFVVQNELSILPWLFSWTVVNTVVHSRAEQSNTLVVTLFFGCFLRESEREREIKKMLIGRDDDRDDKLLKNTSNQNDDDEGQLTSQKALLGIIETSFPLDHVCYVYGYGSGVFSQQLQQESTVSSLSSNRGDDNNNNQQNNTKMIDVILVVDDALQFHNENLQLNSHHYSSLFRYTSSAGVCQYVQRNSPLKDGKVFFHVVDDDDDDQPKMKYGIIHIDDLVEDLTCWKSLYVAGRLHKPTLPIILNTTHESSILSSQQQQQIIEDAQQINLQAAVSSALLLIQSLQQQTAIESDDDNDNHSNHNPTTTTIPWTTLYTEIAGLSYSGDFRMKGAEDPQKVSKLVQSPGQLTRFHNMYYQPILKPLEQQGLLSLDDINVTGGGITWNPYDGSVRKHLVSNLPPNVQSQLLSSSNSADNNLAQLLANIVAIPARNQSVKGVFTLGFRKSIKYATAKLSKGLFRSR